MENERQRIKSITLDVSREIFQDMDNLFSFHYGAKMAYSIIKRGSDVACIDINGDEAECTAEELKKMGVKAFSMEADVSQLNECHRILDEVMKQFGRVDVLVDDAGVTALSDITKIPERDIRWVYEVNVFHYGAKMAYSIMERKSLTQMELTHTISAR